MWFWPVAAAVAGGIALWQWAMRREDDAAGLPPESLPSQPARPAPPPPAPGLKKPDAGALILAERMKACGASDYDLAYTDRWTTVWLGNVMPLRDRLVRMATIIPPYQWPEPVKKMWCALK